MAGVLSRFALVCRTWKDLVYDTSTLWVDVFITLDALKSDKQSRIVHQRSRRFVIPDRVKWRASKAKDAPVNLYIKATSTLIDSDQVTCMLEVIPNIRTFTVFDSSLGFLPLFVRAWSQLREVREAKYFKHTFGDVDGDILRHLAGMPMLISLWLSKSQLLVPYRVESPVLPALTCLILEGERDRLFQSSIAAFLSHCPQIEELYLEHVLGTTAQYPSSAPPITLTKLRKISTRTMSVMNQFSQGNITTPELKELKVRSWEDSYMQLAFDFSAANQSTLTTVVIAVDDGPEYQRMLYPLVNLTFLELDVLRGRGDYLSALYTLPDHHRPTNQPPYAACLPLLRAVRLSLIFTTLLSESFDRFAAARCVPINAQSMTQAGYRALDRLQV
ncbi:hypothetical protein M408DRAFT_26341, partial [Serendipita vermifera MAFF 305830]